MLMEHTIRSLAHLETGEPVTGKAQLTVDLWDENVTDIPCPDNAKGDELGQTSVIGLRRRVALTRTPDGRFIRYQHEGCTTWLDRDAEHIVGWRAWRNCVCMDEYADPISLLLYAWYSDQGVHVIHAGLVSQDGQGILFAGPSWSGKSTSALSCLCAGFDYLGDDRVGLQSVNNGSFVGYSIYNSTQLQSDHLANFPLLSPYALPGDQDNDRVLIHIAQVFPSQLKCTATIRVLVLPRIIKAIKPGIQAASRGRALIALAPSAMLMPFYPKADFFYKLAQLVEKVPAYWLDLPRDPEEIPALVQQILAEVIG
jgi:hypothetical protein